MSLTKEGDSIAGLVEEGQALYPSFASSSTALPISTHGKDTTSACITDGPKKSSGFAVVSRVKTARMFLIKEGDSTAGLVDVSLISFSSERRERACICLEGLKRKGVMEITTSSPPSAAAAVAAAAAAAVVVAVEEEEDGEEEVEEEESSLERSEGFLAARRL